MAMAHGTSHLQVNYSNHMNWLSSSNQIWVMCEWKCKNVSIAGGCNCYCCWCTIFLPLIVFTATISHSAFLRVDLVRRALYTMPNSPAIVTINAFIITIVFTIPHHSFLLHFSMYSVWEIWEQWWYAANMLHFVTLSNRVKQVKITCVENHFFRKVL